MAGRVPRRACRHLTRGSQASLLRLHSVGLQALSEEPCGRERHLADVKHVPFAIGAHGVFVLAAQKTQAVGIEQVLDGVGIVAELAVVKPDGARILLAAVDHLLLAVALDLPRCSRQARGHREAHESDQKQDHHQGITALLVKRPRFAAAGLHKSILRHRRKAWQRPQLTGSA